MSAMQVGRPVSWLGTEQEREPGLGIGDPGRELVQDAIRHQRSANPGPEGTVGEAHLATAFRLGVLLGVSADI
jgi:hypothetical protein